MLVFYIETIVIRGDNVMWRQLLNFSFTCSMYGAKV